jgi:chaperonin GroEL (HSP60 family)
VDRSVEDAIGAVSSAIENGKIVFGGGSPEAEIANRLRKFAQKLSGREQLAVRAFADAMEIVPRSLAENAGLDPIDMLVAIRAEHEKGKINAGVGVFTGGIIDAESEGIVEPLKVKTQAIMSAAEAAEMILRIDDVVSASKMGGGVPGGKGGMPDMGDME